MDWFSLLKFIHVTSFAAWFGTVFASLFVLRTLQPELTGPPENTALHQQLLKKFIQLETKVADAGFKTAVISGLVLAFFFYGWSVWIFVKIGLVILQVIFTMSYIIKAIQPLTYPCSTDEYRKWYKLFAISFTMFALILLVTFFLL
ncbi:hypothetical protein [Prosthecochloris sp. HL-130-GSB]|jgi:uncharacterized membrane protein|uniref:hypothetical protein n=1 Tax=Prosthecochloris sp. HL-130-GSB TaxID=1974213 RepID=UPI000A1C14D5|nr:hypothetical protein [Prosthecochloris sp. HL-130-GSB]ARM31879.1 hypothetical protein B9H02_03725 [Prosthecochloris sp. HL-130-GSB]MBO8093248.1 hypothetical protein [Prosthecochloris sp.]